VEIGEILLHPPLAGGPRGLRGASMRLGPLTMMLRRGPSRPLHDRWLHHATTSESQCRRDIAPAVCAPIVQRSLRPYYGCVNVAPGAGDPAADSPGAARSVSPHG
jgi:hypothetical protein